MFKTSQREGHSRGFIPIYRTVVHQARILLVRKSPSDPSSPTATNPSSNKFSPHGHLVLFPPTRYNKLVTFAVSGVCLCSHQRFELCWVAELDRRKESYEISNMSILMFDGRRVAGSTEKEAPCRGVALGDGVRRKRDSPSASGDWFNSPG